MLRKKRKIYFLCTFCVLLVPVYILAQSLDKWRATEKGGEKNLSLVQTYKGVTPGSGNNLPKVAELTQKEGTWITWPGFLIMENGSSRVFLQTTSTIEYSMKAKKKKIILTIKDAKIFLNNNKNPLVTVHFNTPVKRAYVKTRRKKLELVIELKEALIPSVSQSEVSDGYYYLFLDFPAGNYETQPFEGARPSFTGYGKTGVNDQANDKETPPGITNTKEKTK